MTRVGADVGGRRSVRASTTGGSLNGLRNAGRRWTDPDDDALKLAFEDGTSERDLATNLGRSRGAIRARLVKLGLIEDPGATRFPLP